MGASGTNPTNMGPAALTTEENRLEHALCQTQQACGACGEDFHACDEVLLLQVVRVHLVQNGGQYEVHFASVLDEQGEYLYYPYFLDIGCWEEQLQALKEEEAEMVKASNAICHCKVCGSDILETELVGIINYVEWEVSDREPQGKVEIEYTVGGAPDILCTQCLRTLNNSVLEYWDSFDISNCGECEEGTEERCWRSGECTQGCKKDRERFLQSTG